MPASAWVVLGLFVVAALAMALHTAFSSKDASLHLKLARNFRSAQVSVWIDGDLAYSGHSTGIAKKKFGLIPTDAVQGSLSEIIPVRAGQHTVRVAVEADDGKAIEDTISADFAHHSARDLSVFAGHGALTMSWQGIRSNEGDAPPSGSDWFSRYAGSLLLTIAGSIVSAVAGFVLKELPAKLRPAPEAASKPQLGSN